MYIVAIAWAFVVLLMTVAEATSTQGTVLGAFFTLLLYGVLPLSIVLYVMGTPQRRRQRRAAEMAEAAAQADPDASAASTSDGDGGSQPAGAAVAAEREKP
jgi:ABC-type transport system involved in cytochrome c biogenesis permease subunit